MIELPLETVYNDETSNLSVAHCLFTFPFLHARNFMKRLFYNYALRNFSVGSVALPTGLLLLFSGAGYGVVNGWKACRHWSQQPPVRSCSARCRSWSVSNWC